MGYPTPQIAPSGRKDNTLGYDAYLEEFQDKLGYTPSQHEYEMSLNDGTAYMMPLRSNNSSFLGSVGDFLSGKDGASNLGSLLGGIGGIAQAYIGYKQQKDTAKTNSLYRRLTEKEDAYREKFRNTWGSMNFS